MYITYKTYKGSRRANILSVFGAILRGIGIVCLLGMIGLFFTDGSSTDAGFKERIALGSIIFGVIGVVCFIVGVFLARKADKFGIIDFEKKIKEDLQFTISMGNENPESRELYMQLNPQYNEYVQSGRLSMDDPVNSKKFNKATAKRNYAIFLTLLFVISIPLLILFNNKDGSIPASEEEKYHEYVKLNNDILWRFDASVTPYINQFGTDDTISIPNGDISGITPVVEGFFTDLDTMKEKAMKKPETEVDQSAITLIDETKKTYDIINELCTYYNDGEYKNDNLARAQELHDRYINQIDIWYYRYTQFSEKLDPMAIKIMSKNLDTYKKNGQDFEYYALKLIIDGEAITNYMYDNEIDDTNILSSELTDYNALLSTLNETYEQYKIYAKNKNSSIHLEALEQDSTNFVSTANRIIEVVEKQDLNAGIVHTPGLVCAESEPSPIEDLSYYLSRMISDYNSASY